MKITGALFTLLSCVIMGNGQKSVSFLEPDCGISLSGSRYRIVGGQIADKFGNPWMALIRNSVLCGGSLITARFVLSAAHCMTGSPTTVHLGEFDRSQRNPNALQVPVDAEIRHPKNSHRKNDIGLFRLAWTVRYTDYIKPVCLPTNYNPLAQTTHLTATGWGTTEHGKVSNVLKTTTLTQRDRKTCSSAFGSNVDMSQICAGAPNSHTCVGDSGSPLTAKYVFGGKNRVIQLGIVSYGDKFCRTVGVYTNVLHYMGWIENVVRRGGYQTTPAPTRRPTTPAPTRRPNNNSPSNNNDYYYSPNRNNPTYSNPRRDSPIYYLNSNSPDYYDPRRDYTTYYVPTNYYPTYYVPTNYYPTYYVPSSNYVVYG